MPSKSKSQQRLFGMALAYKRGTSKKASKKVKEIAKDMTEKKIIDFANTKRSKLKENLAYSFEEFLNEAHVDDKGKLQEFDFNDVEHENVIPEFEKNMTHFFQENEAKDIKIDVKSELMMIRFNFYEKRYGIVGNLDTGYAEVAELDSTKREAKIVAQFSDMNILFDMIRENGLYFLRNIE